MTNHDENGKFAPGNKAAVGNGRPPRRVEDDMHNVLTEVARKHWRSITEAMAKEARAGNVYAARYLAEYTIGKPPQILELRAAEAALLAELLKRFEAVGMSAGDVFGAMIAELVEQESETGTDDER